jgi:NAD(P)-dependent dehydrogenase (short-subunit alcohol dehydrogenase family)
MDELQGKVALITGAGRGFGRAIAERFAAAGATLALNYRASSAGCDEVAEQTRSRGGNAIAVQADVTDGPAVAAMVERVVAELGGIDILVNNAGIMFHEPFTASTEAHWRQELEVNVFGPLRLTHLVVPRMMARGGGRIVNLSSQLALVGWEQAPVYSGTKGFILTWTKSLARELGKHNITVNAIGPGSIITDMNANFYPDEDAKRRRAAELPLRRFGHPRDVAECALFLASDAGSFLTGQMLGPNGGNVM